MGVVAAGVAGAAQVSTLRPPPQSLACTSRSPNSSPAQFLAALSRFPETPGKQSGSQGGRFLFLGCLKLAPEVDTMGLLESDL